MSCHANVSPPCALSFGLRRQFTDVRTPFSMMAVKRDGVGLAVKPSVRIPLDLARIAEPKINLADGVARSKVATPHARMNPNAAITRSVTGTSDAFVPYASPLPAQPLTDLFAYTSYEYRGLEARRKQSQRHCARGCHEHKRCQ